MKELDTGRTRSSTYHLPPAPRETAHALDVWVSLGVALVLGLMAATIALWPTEQQAQTVVQSGMPSLATQEPLQSPAAPPPDPSEAQSSPMRFTNPFDTSEVFEFPAGTDENTARDSVAEILLQRARERDLQTSSAKHAHTPPSAPLRIPHLMSKSIFNNASWAASR